MHTSRAGASRVAWCEPGSAGGHWTLEEARAGPPRVPEAPAALAPCVRPHPAFRPPERETINLCHFQRLSLWPSVAAGAGDSRTLPSRCPRLSRTGPPAPAGPAPLSWVPSAPSRLPRAPRRARPWRLPSSLAGELAGFCMHPFSCGHVLSSAQHPCGVPGLAHPPRQGAHHRSRQPNPPVFTGPCGLLTGRAEEVTQLEMALGEVRRGQLSGSGPP